MCVYVSEYLTNCVVIECESSNPYFSSYRLDKSDGGVHLVVDVTASMRRLATPFHLRIKQASYNNGKNTQAWALDNFSVLRTGPEYFSDDFDPALTCHWLEHTGTAKVYVSV